MKTVISCALLFFLAVSVYPESIGEPVLVNSLEARITKTGTVKAIGGTLSYVELNISVPQKTSWQTPSYSGTSVEDSEGNSFVVVKSNSPGNPFRYSVLTNVSTKMRTTESLPEFYSVPDEIRKYILPSSGIESDDEEIAKLAREITENSSSDFERVSNLAIWVYENVRYDETLSGKEQSAKWVLKNRRGVCAEFTSLFVAMARSIGIPAKYVSGYSYTASKGWLGHAWAEVYIGKWVPVDPTWMEAGYLDATHIQVFASNSRKAESSVFVYMSPGTSIEWSGSGTLGSSVREVELLSQQSVPASEKYDIRSGTGNLGPSGETVIYAKLKSEDYRVIDLNLVSCIGASAVSIEEPKRFVILEPGKEKVVVWKIKAPSNIQRGYVYKCPMVLNSAYLLETSITVSIFQGAEEAKLDAWLEKSSVRLGEEQAVSFSSSSYPPGAKISVIADDMIYAYRASQEPERVILTPKSLGQKTVWVFSNFGGVKKLEYDVVGADSLSIGGVVMPKMGFEGEKTNLSFTLVSNSTEPKRVKVNVKYGLEEKTSYITLSGEQELNYTFSDLKPGTGVVVISVEGPGEKFERKINFQVIQKPSVTIQTSFSRGHDVTNVTFLVSKKGEPKNILVYIDGGIAPLSAGSGTIGLEPGTHSVKVIWYDSYGHEYSFEQELDVPKSGTAWETTKTDPCLGFAIVLSTLLFAAGRRLAINKNA